MQFPNPIVNRLIIVGSDGLVDISIGPGPLITFYDGANPMIYIGLWGGATAPRFRIFAAGDPDGAYIELAVSGNIPYVKWNGFVGLTPVSALAQMVGTAGTGRLRFNVEPLATNASLNLVEGIGIALDGTSNAIMFDRTDAFLKRGTFAPWTEDGWHEVGSGGNPIFDNSFGNLGGGWDTLAFRFMPDGTVQFKGAVTRAVAAANNLQIFQLPVGFRPALLRAFPVANLGGLGAANKPSVRIFANGAVTVWEANASAPTAIALDSVRFTII